MPLLPGQLARQRQKAETDLTDFCEIHRGTTVISTLGERINGWAPVAQDVPCRLQSVGSVTGRERLRLEALAQVTDWVLVVPYDQDLTSEDRVYITSMDPMRSFEVSQVLGPHTDMVRLRALLTEVT